MLYTQLLPFEVIEATEIYIRKMEKKNAKLVKSQRKKTYTLKKEDKEEATFQSLICQFVYTILL